MLLDPSSLLPDIPQEDRASLIMVMGLPATGRSTTARDLGQHLKAPVVNQNLFLDSLTGPFHPSGVGERIRDWLCDSIGYYLTRGQTVVLDGETFTKQARRPFLQVAMGLGHAAYGVWVQCGPNSHRLIREHQGYSSDLIEAIRLIFQAPQSEEGFRMIVSHFSDYPPLFTDP